MKLFVRGKIVLKGLNVPNVATILFLFILVASIFGIGLIGSSAVDNFSRSLSGRCEASPLVCDTILQFVPELQKTTFSSMLATSNLLWYFLLPLVGVIAINYAFLHRIFVRTLNFSNWLIGLLAVVFGLSTLPLGSFIGLTAMFYAIAGAYASYMFVVIAIFGIFILGLESVSKSAKSYSGITNLVKKEIDEETNRERKAKMEEFEKLKTSQEETIKRVKEAIRTKSSATIVTELTDELAAIQTQMQKIHEDLKLVGELRKETFNRLKAEVKDEEKSKK